MKHPKTTFSLLLFGILISLAFVPFNKESSFLTQLKDKLTKRAQQFPEEKIYIHTDRTFYMPDELFWFKAYLLNGETHKYSQLSKVIYADLISPSGEVLQSWTMQSESGIAMGDCYFPSTVKGGVYTLKAYTNWMKNQGKETFFEKQITIQKIITPRLLMKLDFNERAYGASDWVNADVSIRTLEDKPLANKTVSYQVNIDGKKIITQNTKTDAKGKTTIKFQLPATLTSSDGLLNVLISHEGNKESIARAIPIVLNTINMSFFPEGGHLMKGVTSTLAFKATNEHGKGADVEGFITDATGTKVATFKSFHLGLGKCKFKPEAGKEYFAQLTQPSGNQQKFKLPQAVSSGQLLAISPIDQEKIQVKVYSEHHQKANLIGQTRGVPFFSQTIDVKKGWNTLDVKTTDFPMGIAQFTLFGTNKKPQAERLVFLNPHKQLKIDITTNKNEYKPRELVELSVKTTDETGVPVPTNLSLAVVDDKLFSLADDKQHTIQSWLLVGSDLKGKVEEPNFYFKPEEAKAIPALDLLMLTHGWRKFDWKDIDSEVSYKYAPETDGVIYGYVIHKRSGKPVKAQIYLTEYVTGKIAKGQTDQSGIFTFTNINTFSSGQVFARSDKYKAEELEVILGNLNEEVPFPNINSEDPSNLPDKIDTDGKKSSKKRKNNYKSFKNSRTSYGKTSPVKGSAKTTNSGNITLSSDGALEEVVIVSAGYETKNVRAPLRTYIRARRNSDALNTNLMSDALSGRVAGLSVADNPKKSIQLRGSTSVTGNHKPLFVVDGIPTNLDNLNQTDPNSIESITVLKGASAAALYGSRGANGVIVIELKNSFTSSTRRGAKRKVRTYGNYAIANYAALANKPFSSQRTFFAPDYLHAQNPEVKSDFRNTIFWEGDLQTDAKGEASVSFYNSDASTVFRVIAEGVSIYGDIGHTEHTYSTMDDLEMVAKVPAYLTFEDQLKLPVILKNGSESEITGQVKLLLPKQLTALEDTKTITLEANTAKTYYFDVKANNISGKGNLTLVFQNEFSQIKVQQSIEVLPKGFPISFTLSSNQVYSNAKFDLSDIVEGSLSARLMIYPDAVGQALSGIEGMLRQPHGCFEQVSSSTYPNILVLNFLKESGISNPEIEKRALQYIADGYKRLAGYEVNSSNGFSLYGRPNASAWLTAYGLMEFSDMQKVYDGVNQKMMNRTVNFLLKTKDGKGGFKGKKYTYRNGQYSITENAYIIYALSHVPQTKNEIKMEFETAYQQAIQDNNLYRLGLLANAGFNLGQTEKAEKLTNILIEKLKQTKELDQAYNGRTITYSYGRNANTSVLALSIMATLRQKTSTEILPKLIQVLLSKRSSYGYFGSTRTTVLALKAIIAYTKFYQDTNTKGTLELLINNTKTKSIPYDAITVNQDLSGLLKSTAAKSVSIRLTDTEKGVPYSFDVNWTARTPLSDKDCEVELETSLASTTAKVGETVRLSAIIQNKTDKGLPSTVAIIGIPSGLAPQPWQLKKLMDDKVIDYYEMMDNQLVVHYIDLAPSVKKVVNIDLKAEIPGTFRAPASAAYLYYVDEYKSWQAGESITIEE